MKPWHLFPTISAPMSFQMALDEILFRRKIEGTLHQPILRIYFSSGAWITTGYSDPGPFPADAKVCKRITGGGRVEHGKDVIFSLIADKEDDESFKSVRVSYWKIHEAVKAAFEKLGKQPRFYRCDEKLPRPPAEKAGITTECFVYPIATDLALDNKKVAGGAQKRSSGVLLHQESVQIPAKMDAFNYAEALRKSFEEKFEITLQDVLLDPELLEEAKKLARDKYAGKVNFDTNSSVIPGGFLIKPTRESTRANEALVIPAKAGIQELDMALTE